MATPTIPAAAKSARAALCLAFRSCTTRIRSATTAAKNPKRLSQPKSEIIDIDTSRSNTAAYQAAKQAKPGWNGTEYVSEGTEYTPRADRQKSRRTQATQKSTQRKRDYSTVKRHVPL